MLTPASMSALSSGGTRLPYSKSVVGVGVGREARVAASRPGAVWSCRRRWAAAARAVVWLWPSGCYRLRPRRSGRQSERRSPGHLCSRWRSGERRAGRGPTRGYAAILVRLDIDVGVFMAGRGSSNVAPSIHDVRRRCREHDDRGDVKIDPWIRRANLTPSVPLSVVREPFD